MTSLAGNAPDALERRESTRGIWREVELALLLVLVLGIYFSRLTDLTIRGEESRWARVAHEMMETGDWIVPRQQGEPFPDRPPLNSWTMIAAAKLTGQLNLAAIRLPSVTATLLTTLLIYWYTRQFLSRMGAFAAAASFATMGQVLQLGRMAESDALLTLCLSAALFGWHQAYERLGNPRRAWLLGYLLAALAGLAKGPQGPIYFVAITTGYLMVRRDWAFLCNRWHLAGLSLFALIIGAWQLPFLWAVGAEGVGAIWSEGGEVSQRFHYAGLRQALKHWAVYPWEVFGSMAPWSFLLPVLASRWLRQRLGDAQAMYRFALTACAVTFPTCWLPAESRARYFMSMYPCVAVLVGLVIERSWQATESGWWPKSWQRYSTCGAALIGGAGLLVGVGRLVVDHEQFELVSAVSVPFAMAYLASAAVAIRAVLWAHRRPTLARAQVGTLALAGFMGLTYTGTVVDLQMHTSNLPADSIAQVHALIPPGEQLESLDPVHHLFAYYYEAPIKLQKLPKDRLATEVSSTIFCFAEDPSVKSPEILFAWDPIAEISCERARSNKPRVKVVIGRRRDPAEMAIADEPAETSGISW